MNDGKVKKNQSSGPGLEELMRTYGNDVLRMAYLYVKDIHTAEDMFQEVFIKVNKNLEQFRGESDIKTWLMRITINTCKDYLKSAYHTKVVPMTEYEEDSLEAEDDFEKLEQAEKAKTVREAVMELPEKYRDVVICIYFNNMSVEATAKELNMQPGTVKSRLSRAREKLKPVLERRLSDE